MLIAAAVCLALLAARSSVARAYRVGGGCDAPTLLVNDLVWVNLAAYDFRVPFTSKTLSRRADPKSGDIVLCKLPGRAAPMIKRVVAVGEDTVELRNNRLLINGQTAAYEDLDAKNFAHIAPINHMGDSFAIEQLGGTTHMIAYSSSGSPVATFGPATVPPEHYFLLGDNRDNSYDSRCASCGSVPRSAILGRLIGEGHSWP
jgi:signal peptidase I